MELEEWRPVVGWLDYYEVSSGGRVRSLDRIVRHSPSGGDRRLSGRVLKQCVLKMGYPAVAFSFRGRHTTYYVHDLVARAFLGDPPAGHWVNHLDGNKLNPHLDNLEWATPKDNLIHAGKTGLGGKVTPEQVIEIRERCANGEIQRTLAREFSIDQTQISNIHLRKSWGYL